MALDIPARPGGQAGLCRCCVMGSWIDGTWKCRRWRDWRGSPVDHRPDAIVSTLYTRHRQTPLTHVWISSVTIRHIPSLMNNLLRDHTKTKLNVTFNTNSNRTTGKMSNRKSCEMTGRVRYTASRIAETIGLVENAAINIWSFILPHISSSTRLPPDTSRSTRNIIILLTK